MTTSNSNEKPNGNSTVHDWLIHIDSKLTEMHSDLISKLDDKADDIRVDRLEDRLEKTEHKTNRIELKQAGIAATTSGLVLVVKNWLGW